MSIASRIRETRQAAGLSKTELAEHCQVSSRTIQRWETGRTRPRGCAEAMRLAEALGVEFGWLVSGEGPKTLEAAKFANIVRFLNTDELARLRREFIRSENCGGSSGLSRQTENLLIAAKARSMANADR